MAMILGKCIFNFLYTYEDAKYLSTFSEFDFNVLNRESEGPKLICATKDRIRSKPMWFPSLAPKLLTELISLPNVGA